MIPKTIHYCWFGGNEKTELVKKCIESWKRCCPDYQIVEWNEGNFDVASNTFVKEAYDSKKYAFVADYVRLWALYHYGGIYMDSDVELLRPLDEHFLEHEAFSGFEKEKNPLTGIMGAVQGFDLFGKALDYYKDRHFIMEDGTFDMTTNVTIFRDDLTKRGLLLNNQFQVIDGFALYPSDWFCPLDDSTGILHKTENTYTIHWFSKSWWDKKSVRKYKRIKLLFHLLGEKQVKTLSKIKRKIFK